MQQINCAGVIQPAEFLSGVSMVSHRALILFKCTLRSFSENTWCRGKARGTLCVVFGCVLKVFSQMFSNGIPFWTLCPKNWWLNYPPPEATLASFLPKCFCIQVWKDAFNASNTYRTLMCCRWTFHCDHSGGTTFTFPAEETLPSFLEAAALITCRITIRSTT